MPVELFRKYLEKHGLEYEIIIADEPTSTAVEAANVHKVPVSNIVKSLLTKIDRRYVLFLVPGDKRLDLDEVSKRFEANEVRMANADEVKSVTGHSIGGVPPFGHLEKIETHIEEGFSSESELVAAAGHSNAVFKIPLSELKNIIS